MRFTQFKFPHGRKVPAVIDRSPEIEAMARQLSDSGWSFEIEINSDTQIVHMDCCDEERALANRVCRNGPEVPGKVDELVREAHEVWLMAGRAKAVGSRIPLDLPELYDSTREP